MTGMYEFPQETLHKDIVTSETYSVGGRRFQSRYQAAQQAFSNRVIGIFAKDSRFYRGGDIYTARDFIFLLMEYGQDLHRLLGELETIRLEQFRKKD